MSLVGQEPEKRILIDAREFVPNRRTGIGRVLEGFSDAMAETCSSWELVMAGFRSDLVPSRLRNKANVRFLEIPGFFLMSEMVLSRLSRHSFDLFISPYPKLPLWGINCPSVHIVHDVLDLTHPAYRRRLRVIFDGYRLRKALRHATVTWYDSEWSLTETERYAGFVGKDPRVRHPGIDPGFNPTKPTKDERILSKYARYAGYILAVGNGMPHKNLGVLLKIAPQTDRRLLFVGVHSANEVYWKSRFPTMKASWLPYLQEEELPAIMRAAFCLAQPSTAEGYGYPPLEAMACAVPAVVSDIPVLRETTGGNALEANPDNPEAWIESFNALEGEEIYKNQVQKGLKWVEPLQGSKAWKGHISDTEELLK
jgi:glycosyltransferase involved in cell wall biosynthesis